MAIVEAEQVIERLNSETSGVQAVLESVAALVEVGADDPRKRKRLDAELSRAVADSTTLKEAMARLEADGSRASLAVSHVIRQLAAGSAWRDHPIVHEVLEETLRLNELLLLDPDAEDPEWIIRETIAQIIDLLDQLRQEIAHNSLAEPAIAAHYVAIQLGSVAQADVAMLLGVDPRTLRTWKSSARVSVRKNPDRVVLVAQLVRELLHGFTAHGVAAWFKRPRHQLNGKTPLELIGRDPLKAAEPLWDLATGGRAQLGT